MAQDPLALQTDVEDERQPLGGEAPSFRVFILEDDGDLVDVFEAWLHGHYGSSVTVHSAGTLAEAAEVLEPLYRLDFAIIDRSLPDGEGEELLDELIATFDPILVMITGTVPGPELVGLPIHDYLIKPVDEERLIKGLSLLEKLEASGSLSDYSEARKASVLEYYLENPEANPVFRRFAARWEYDRLEIAVYDGEPVVYELYLGNSGQGAQAGGSDVYISIAGGLSMDLASLLDEGVIAAEGELVPSGGGDYAWVKRDPDATIDTGDGTIGIYQFTCPVPEQYLTDLHTSPVGLSLSELTSILEAEYN